MSSYSDVIYLFLGVDWPMYMRRPFVEALGAAAEANDTAIVAINRPLCPLSVTVKKPHRIGELFGSARTEQLAPNLFLYSPRYVLHDHLAPRIPGLMSLNIKALRTGLTRLSNRLGIDSTCPIVWYNYPQQSYVSQLFPESYVVYDLYDSLYTILGPAGPNVALEASRRGSVDLLVTASMSMRKKYSEFYPDSYSLGNGLAESAYQSLVGADTTTEQRLDSIEEIPHPRIGYAGMIGNRINWDLIRGLANKRSDWNFVFVGHKATQIPEDLDQISNLHFIPPVKQELVPTVLRSFDVGLMPYLDTEFFHDSNPLKFYEYAAAGLPSVCTPVRELERYDDQLVAVLAPNVDLWEHEIERQLSDDRDVVAKLGLEIVAERRWEPMAANLLDYLLLRISDK